MIASVTLVACGGGNGQSSDDGSDNNSDAFEPEVLKVQFVPTRSENTVDARSKPLEDLLSEELGIPVELSISTDYSTIIEAMASKQVDLGIMPPNAYVLAKERDAAVAILQSQLFGVEQPGGQPTDEKVPS